MILALWRQKSFRQWSGNHTKICHINVYFGFGQIHFLICRSSRDVVGQDAGRGSGWWGMWLEDVAVVDHINRKRLAGKLMQTKRTKLAHGMERQLRSNPGWTKTLSEVYMPAARTKKVPERDGALWEIESDLELTKSNPKTQMPRNFLTVCRH